MAGGAHESEALQLVRGPLSDHFKRITLTCVPQTGTVTHVLCGGVALSDTQHTQSQFGIGCSHVMEVLALSR